MSEHFTAIPAVYVLFRRGSQILLLQRANTGYLDGYYSMPADHVDGRESAVTAAIREAREEVGAKLTRADLQFVHVQHRVANDPSGGYTERINFMFAVDDYAGELRNCEPEKCSDLRWCVTDDLPHNIIPELPPVLQAVAAGQYYSDFDFTDSPHKLNLEFKV